MTGDGTMKRQTITLDSESWDKVCEYRALELLKRETVTITETINRMIHAYVI